MVTCRGCGAVHEGRGSISVEQVEPVPDAPWRATCWHCGWFDTEHHLYPEDAEGDTDHHLCPVCPACGHRDHSPAGSAA
jgi:hypothetical protein